MGLSNFDTKELDEKFLVDSQGQEDFKQNGHVLLRNVMSSESAIAFRGILERAVQKLNTEYRSLSDRDTYGKAFLQVMNIWRADSEVAKFVLAKRFAHIAAQLLGVEQVRLYHDQALFKEPGGGPTPWHQDQYYWPIDTPKTVTMWMPLIDVTDGMGLLTFASKSHVNGRVFNTEISDESEHLYASYVRENNFPISRPTYMEAGDATWHYGYTIHNAPGNESDRMRAVMTIIYVADGAKVIKPQNPSQLKDLESWMPGMKPGDGIDSELNPILL